MGAVGGYRSCGQVLSGQSVLPDSFSYVSITTAVFSSTCLVSKGRRNVHAAGTWGERALFGMNIPPSPVHALYCLMKFQPVRFNEMRRYLGKVTDKTLSMNLKELEADGLVMRKEYPQVPPKVEYSLTSLGESLMEVLDQLCTWGEQHMG